MDSNGARIEMDDLARGMSIYDCDHSFLWSFILQALMGQLPSANHCVRHLGIMGMVSVLRKLRLASE